MGADEAGRGHRQTGDEDAKQQGDTTNRNRYRRATLLILTGSLTFLVSLAVLLFMNHSPSRDDIGLLPGNDMGVPNRLPLSEPLPELILPEPISDLPRLPGESLEEYILRTDAEEREATARRRLGAAIAAPLDANGQTALQAELREIVVLLDEARQLREFGIVARIEALAEAEGPGSSPEAEAPPDSLLFEGAAPTVEGPGDKTASTSGDGTQTAATIAGIVALLTAIAGLVAAVAGLFTALATWIKARRQPASTDKSASG